MATDFTNAVRNRIQGLMATAGVELSRKDELQSLEWVVRGDHQDGVFARFTDADDVIELSLLQRLEGEPVNVLDWTLAFDMEKATASVFSKSSTNSEMNFTGSVVPGSTSDDVFMAFDFLTQMLQA